MTAFSKPCVSHATMIQILTGPSEKKRRANCTTQTISEITACAPEKNIKLRGMVENKILGYSNKFNDSSPTRPSLISERRDRQWRCSCSRTWMHQSHGVGLEAEDEYVVLGDKRCNHDAVNIPPRDLDGHVHDTEPQIPRPRQISQISKRDRQSFRFGHRHTSLTPTYTRIS